MSAKRLRAPLRWLLYGVVALSAMLFVYHFYLLAMLCWWRNHNPGPTALMQQRLVVMKTNNRDAQLAQQWMPYAKISTHLKRAVLIAEDDKFLAHAGFDWDGIQSAMRKNEQRGRIVAGGSTISQQLAKNLFLSSERSYLRKGQEAIITVMMEAVLDKKRILEIYLNVIEWGEGVFGADAAARHYFGISAANLNVAQAARLAAMVPRPRFYDRNRTSPYLATRAQWVEQRLSQAVPP